MAHLAIAEAAWHQGGVDRVDLVLSEDPLGKRATVAPLAGRVSVLEAIASSRPWLGVRVSGKQLIAEVVEGYDAVVLGADKWLQVVDPAWYGGSVAGRDAAVARLPRLLVVPRAPHTLPPALPSGAVVLQVDAGHGPVSSTGVRAGRAEWMAAEARAAGLWTARGIPAAPGDSG